MKQIQISLLLLLNILYGWTLFASPLADEANYTFYYSSVEFVETPLSQMKGSIALSRGEAMRRNHYRFTYNQKHQLVSVSFFNGNTPREPNHTANLFTLSHRMEFSYQTNSEKISFYNKDQIQVPVLGNCYYMLYTYNPLGFRKDLYFLDKEENRIQNNWGIYTYKWEYQADGSVIESRYDDKKESAKIRPGFEFYRIRLYFNHRGHIALMQNIDEQGNLLENSSGAAQDRIICNVHGNFLEWNVLDDQGELEKGNGPDVAIGMQGANKYGYEISLENKDEHRLPICSNYGICKSRTSFDDFGNIKERRFFDQNGKPALHLEAGYHKLLIKWDKSGNHRLSLSYYDTDNEPTYHLTRGFHSVRHIYDKKDRLIKISYHNPEGELVNRKDRGMAYSIFLYDEKSSKRSSKHFDKAGKEIGED